MKRQSKKTRNTSKVPVTIHNRSHVERNGNAQLKQNYLNLLRFCYRPDSGTNIYNQHCFLSLLSSRTKSSMNQIGNDQFDSASPWVLSLNTKVASKSKLVQMEIVQNLTAGSKQNFFESFLLRSQGQLGNNIFARLQTRSDLDHFIELTERRIFIRQHLLELIKCYSTQPSSSSCIKRN